MSILKISKFTHKTIGCVMRYNSYKKIDTYGGLIYRAECILGTIKHNDFLTYIDIDKKFRILHMCQIIGKSSVDQTKIYVKYMNLVKRTLDNNYIDIDDFVREYNLSQGDILYILYEYASKITNQKVKQKNIDNINVMLKQQNYFVEKYNNMWILNRFDGSNIFNSNNYEKIYGIDAFDNAIISYISQKN